MALTRAPLQPLWALGALTLLITQCSVVSLPDTTWPCRNNNDCLAAFECRDYICVKSGSPLDSGRDDAGHDAGPVDAGPFDAGTVDGGVDGGRSDAGALDATSYLVVWQQWFPDGGDFRSWARLLGSDGGLVGPAFALDDMFGPRAPNCLSMPVGIDGGFAMTSNAAPRADAGGPGALQVLYLSSDGTPQGASSISKTPYSAGISSSGSALAVGWTEPNFVSGLAGLRTNTWPPKTLVSPFLLDGGATVGVACAKTGCAMRMSWFGVPHQMRSFDLHGDGGVGAPYVFPADAGDVSLYALASDRTKFFIAQATPTQILLRPFTWSGGALTPETVRVYPIPVRAFFGAPMGFACTPSQCLLVFQTAGAAGLSAAIMPTGALGTASTFVVTEHDGRDSTVAVHGDQFLVAYEGPPTSPGIYVKFFDPPYNAPTTVPGLAISSPLPGHVVHWPQAAGLP